MKYFAIVATFSLILFVSGCIFGGTVDSEVFVGGDEGLVVSFVGDNPPPRVFQNRNFNVILQLENKGEYNIYPGDVRMFFSNGQNFGLSGDDPIKYNEEFIQKRLKTDTGFIPGSLIFIPYNDLAYSGPTMLTEDAPISIALDVCYPYNTTAVADICVSRDGQASEICDPLGEPVPQTTGGPIFVSSVNQLFNGLLNTKSNDTLLQLKLGLDIIGQGDIYSSDTACGELGDKIRLVTVDQLTVGDYVFEGDELIKMCGLSADQNIGLNEDGEGDLICTILVPDVFNDFEDRFTITFSYTHNQIITKQIAVMPVLESMERCATNIDCDKGTYCEKPGFCRQKIPDGVPCGLPNEYNVNDDIDTKISNKSQTCENECLILQDPTLAPFAIEAYGICSFDYANSGEDPCKSASDCLDGQYCARYDPSVLITSQENSEGIPFGYCAPKIPLNYPCHWSFNDGLGASCIRGKCSPSSGLCIL
jgi:hypothetical protein